MSLLVLRALGVNSSNPRFVFTTQITIPVLSQSLWVSVDSSVKVDNNSNFFQEGYCEAPKRYHYKQMAQSSADFTIINFFRVLHWNQLFWRSKQSQPVHSNEINRCNSEFECSHWSGHPRTKPTKGHSVTRGNSWEEQRKRALRITNPQVHFWA